MLPSIIPVTSPVAGTNSRSMSKLPVAPAKRPVPMKSALRVSEESRRGQGAANGLARGPCYKSTVSPAFSGNAWIFARRSRARAKAWGSCLIGGNVL